MDSTVSKKKHTGLLVVIFLLSGLLLGGGCCYYYLTAYKGFKKCPKTTSVVKDNKDNTQEKVSYDVSSIFVKDLIARYDYAAPSSSNIYRTLYTGNFVSSAMSNDLKLILAFANTNHSINGNVTKDELDVAMKKLFGSNFSYTDGTVKNCGSCNCGDLNFYNYDDYKAYSYVAGNECGCTTNEAMLRKIVATNYVDGKLTVTVAACIKKGDDNNIYDMDSIYPNLKADSFDIDKDYDKINNYNYNFVYDKENNNFYLESITKK